MSLADALKKALEDYQKEWRTLVEKTNENDFFKSLTPTAVAWKVTDLAEFNKLLLELSKECDQVHLSWINERWLGTLHLKDKKLPWRIKVIKLMQRRPKSRDPVGLDHVDFLLPKDTEAGEILAKEPSIKWTKEMNSRHCKWISIWFSGTEAKIRSDTVIDVAINELSDINPNIDKK